MGIRRLSRQRALQLLYALEYSSEEFNETEAQFLKTGSKRRKNWGAFAHELARLTHEHGEELDKEISTVLDHWSIDRLPRLDRLCLRMAVCEFRYFPDIPVRVTLDEYVELAKLYGTEESPQFINGVLDKIAKNYQQKDFQAGKKETA